ncbi:VOC family protein [Methanimicrococcus blatticola]|uniref:PhnB protein n=1 Tax=Methanimicrococcus blatticola TaxID=91560 RepID=A0A484F583_9EURY|nr:VOC family protein [Methanimicrococcus blatticola]MCC2509134.1 VOC family protein [Methanimicrococcus blatticola]TDQ69500.1 PhnB protein [Methanimicrococcus blatticola]
MIGVEIDMIVSDSLKALELYEKIFEVQRIEATDLEKGLNEAVFTIYGTRFHLLDENPAYGMIAAKPEETKAIWFNIIVPDIAETFKKATDAGCTVIQPMTEMEEMGVINAMFSDAFGTVWMLHQIVKEVSYEDRVKAMENMK